jgi:hypothetical protein
MLTSFSTTGGACSPTWWVSVVVDSKKVLADVEQLLVLKRTPKAEGVAGPGVRSLSRVLSRPRAQ